MSKHASNKERSSIPKMVLNNTIPSILAMIMVIVHNMADLFFIGQTGDPYQVAAVSLATPIFMIFMAISTVFGVGGTSSFQEHWAARMKGLQRRYQPFAFWGQAYLV